MKDSELDAYIDASSSVLGFTIEDTWRPAVRANLKVSLDFARQIDEFILPDESEPANVYSA